MGDEKIERLFDQTAAVIAAEIQRLAALARKGKKS